MRLCVKMMGTREDISRGEMAAEKSVLGAELARKCLLEIKRNYTRGVSHGNEVVQDAE